MGFKTYTGITKYGDKNVKWRRRAYDDGLEHITFIVKYRVVKARLNRKSFWLHVPPSLRSPPPIDEEHLGPFLAAHLERRGIPLPQVVQVQRNQAKGENAGFHSVGLFVVQESGVLRVLRSYGSVRGIPHAPPERDYYFKRGSLRGFASQVRSRPADPAALAQASLRLSSPDSRVWVSRPDCAVAVSVPQCKVDVTVPR